MYVARKYVKSRASGRDVGICCCSVKTRQLMENRCRCQYLPQRFNAVSLPATTGGFASLLNRLRTNLINPRISRIATGKMVNGFRYYRALESVSIASALSTALIIYPCQIRVHQRPFICYNS